MAFVLELPERKEGPKEGPKEGHVDVAKVSRGEVLRKAVQEALTQQVDNAIRAVGEASDPEASAAVATEAVHEARKSVKRIRSTLRLLRRGLGRKLFTAESQSFAKVGRALSDTRESQVMAEVLQSLSRAVASEPPTPPLSPPPSEEQPAPTGYGEAVAAAEKAWQASPHPAARFPTEQRAELLKELETARDRLAKWSLRGGIQRSLRSGLQRAMRRARRDWKVVCQPGLIEEKAVQFHELRKRVKDLYYMSVLLQPAQPEFLGDLTAQLDELADLLGDDHDLTILAERAAAHPEELGGPAVVTPLLEFGSYRQHALREAAQPLLESVLEVKPRRLAEIIVQGLRDRLD